MLCILPVSASQYSFDGYLHMIFASQDFEVSGYAPLSISGEDVLVDVFGQERDVSPWGMFGVLVAWVIFFRLVHYALFLRASAPFLKKTAPAPAPAVKGSMQTTIPTTSDAVDKAGTPSSAGTYELVTQGPKETSAADTVPAEGALEDVL
jgi:hypothetical protein